jgi:WD40 repeat protein
VWDVESGKTVLEIGTGLSGVNAACYSPGMTMIATASGGHNSLNIKNEFIKIWDTNTGKLVTNIIDTLGEWLA